MNKIAKLFITFISAITLTLSFASSSLAKVDGEYIVLGAAFLGEVRLIDNIEFCIPTTNWL